MKKLFITLVFLCCSLFSFSQETPFNKLGSWLMFSGNHKLSDTWSIKSLAHVRNYELASEMRQFTTRLGIDYKINDTYSVTFGHVYSDLDLSYKENTNKNVEHRIYEDFNIKHKIKALNVSHRFRFEHRFPKNNTIHWLRYKLGFSKSISKKWSMSIYDEVFLNFEGDTFALNWLGCLFNYSLTDNLKLQTGYQRNTLPNSQGSFNRILLGIAITTNHFKK